VKIEKPSALRFARSVAVEITKGQIEAEQPASLGHGHLALHSAMLRGTEDDRVIL
jgi:hypothetical protein